MEYCPYCMDYIEAKNGECPVCGNTSNKEIAAHHLIPGTVLNRKILVGGVLGEGGFGITYIGRDQVLDMKVAIKEYYPHGYVNRNNATSSDVTYSVSADSTDFFKKGRERFLGEARILAKFSGEPGIVEVRDFFEENNTAYIIMEYLDGQDLKQFLAESGTLTPEYTIHMLTPIMNALVKIHKQGLIHRDISPDNIRLTGGKAKLLDFGAARGVSAIANKSLSVMLKPGFAPEEQYRSKGNQGAWTDVYALCATIYKCITGITPDDSTQRVFCDELQTPTALGFKIDSDIETALMKGLAVLQKDRYQSVEELLNGFRGINISVQSDERTISTNSPVSEDDIETRYISSEENTSTQIEVEISSGNTDETIDSSDELKQHEEPVICATGNPVVEDDTQTQYLDEVQLDVQADEDSAENAECQQPVEETVDNSDKIAQNEAVADAEESSALHSIANTNINSTNEHPILKKVLLAVLGVILLSFAIFVVIFLFNNEPNPCGRHTNPEKTKPYAVIDVGYYTENSSHIVGAKDAVIEWKGCPCVDGYIVEMYLNDKWTRVSTINSYETTTYRKFDISYGTSFRIASYNFVNNNYYYSEYSYITTR